ncbi:MAG: ABC transporter permease [Candidatus Aenigmatarchaeota archaeon]
MIELEAIYWILKRELIRFWRDRSRVISSFIQPMLFLLVLGSGFSFLKIGDTNYQIFLFPGVVAISLVGISIATGISVIWDREFGVLKEILVAPISRFSIFLGKALSGCLMALIQGFIVILLGIFLSIPINLDVLLISISLMILISLSLVSIGLIIASLIDTIESFGVIMNFLVFPMIFLSGAFYPLAQAPNWLRIISYLNPLTYGVDALRYVIIGKSYFSFLFNVSILICFSFLTLLIGSFAFNMQK